MAGERSNRKRRRNRSHMSLVLKLLCGVGVIGALTLGATVFFRVENVAVSGNSRYSQEEIVGASGIKPGDNLFHMNKFQIEGELRHGLPYLEDVTINRQLPNGVVIEVKEWGAAAQILPVPGAAPAHPAEEEEKKGEAPPDPAASADPAGSSSAASSEEKSAASSSADRSVPEEELLLPAEEPWLISIGGKLLEKPPAGCPAMLVSGLTILAPEAGTMVKVPEKEKLQLEGLVELLQTLSKLDRLELVSAVDVGETTMTFSYLDRFDVKLALNADFTYKLNFLDEMVKRLDEKHGADCRGSIDLNREDYGGAYLPEV